MSSLIRPLEDLTPSTRVLVAARRQGQRRLGGHLGSDRRPRIDDASEVLDLLAKADVGGYAANSWRDKAQGASDRCAVAVWVDAMQYGRAEDVLIRFMRDSARQILRLGYAGVASHGSTRRHMVRVKQRCG